MKKVYKDINEFFMVNFPNSYLAVISEEEITLQHYINTSSDLLIKSIKEIMQGDRLESHDKKPVQSSIP